MEQITKDRLKNGVAILKSNSKIFTAATGPLAIALLYPKETLSFLTSLREAGFELPSLAVLGVGMYFFRSDVVRIVNGSLGGVTKAIQEVSQKFEIHLQESEKFKILFAENQAENNTKFNDLAQKVVMIEQRMQVLVPIPDNVKELTEEIRSELELDHMNTNPKKGIENESN